MIADPLAAVASLSVLVTVVIALYAFYGNAVPAATRNARARLEGLMSGTSVVETGPVALRKAGDAKSIFAFLANPNLSEKLEEQLERADMTIRPGEYIVMRFVVAGVAAMFPLLLFPGLTGFLVAGVAAVIGYNLPKIYMNRRRKSRVNKLNAQLPEALVMISNSLKAGFGLLQSLNVASDQLAHPISTELSRSIHEMNIGSSAEEALVALGERSGSYDMDIVVTAILVQRTVGGNLGEILDNVAETMRERIRIRGEIQTLTSQQKLTGIVIGLLPIGVGIMFSFMSWEYIAPLFTTLTGKGMLVVATVLEVVGVLIIQRILNIEV